MAPEHATAMILIIDDTPDILKMLQRHLEYWGYHVLTASRGEEGLALADREQPDVILLDMLMPTIKGRQVCARLKRNPRTADIPVIFLTALNLADHIKAGLDAGAEDYLIKPFRAEELQERIRVCLFRHGKQQPIRTES